jgi:hypothetical protein
MQKNKLIKVGIENNNEGRSLAWALDYPGCFTYGSSETEALVRVPQALIAYKNWLDGYTENSWLQDLTDFDIRLVEVYEGHFLNEQYEPSPNGKAIYAWFHHDWLPLSELEVQRGLSILGWAHQDLYELTAALSDEQLDRTYPGERSSIRGIMLHVANAELNYLDHLRQTPLDRTGSPDDIWERLRFSLDQNRSGLPALVGKEDVHGNRGEFWSSRKVLRRACWHALDHCQHIHRLITS